MTPSMQVRLLIESLFRQPSHIDCSAEAISAIEHPSITTSGQNSETNSGQIACFLIVNAVLQ
jgi:hypothetical protein